MSKKDKKYQVSTKEALSLYLRALKMIRRLNPWYLELNVMDSAASNLFHTFRTFVFARMLTELAGLRRLKALLIWAAIWVGSMIITDLTHYFFFHIQQVKSNFNGERRWNIFDKKFCQMDYVDAERQEIRDKYFKIKQDQDWQSMGIHQVAGFAYIISDIIGVLGGIALAAGFVILKAPADAPGAAIINSPITILLVIVSIILTQLSGVKLSDKISKNYMELSESSGQSNRVNILSAKVSKDEARALDMRIYNQQAFLLSMRRKDVYENYGKERYKYDAGCKGGLLGVVYSLVYGLSYVVTIFVCSAKAWAGAYSIGQITQYVQAIRQVANNISGIGERWNFMKRNAYTVKNAFEFLDIKNEMYQGSLTTEKRSDRDYDIEFKNVSFKYPNAERWAVRNLSLKFKVGTRLAVVGENGSGKTTFIKLLCRLYDPQEGEILLNGINIKKYDYQDYAGVFSVVFQDYFLLAQPLGENIAGAKEYDREKAEKCLTDAGFGERLKELPKGLDTYLYKEYDTEGVQISGGEAQKIAIARALYKNAPFIILDEPTAALDPIAEAEIYSKFDGIVGDKTAVYISHRLSSCRFCDEILVFHEGGLVQQGGHKELLDSEGLYQELWHAQAKYYVEEEKRKKMEAEREAVGMGSAQTL